MAGITRIFNGKMDATSKLRCGNIDNQSLPLASAGFTYIAMLIFIAIISVVLASIGEVWHMAVQREKENELLFVGNQFRRALDQYSRTSVPGVNRFPMSLDDLLQDPRFPNTKRHLRKIFMDPITGTTNWGLYKGPSGEIMGVYSLSENEPVKKHNFNLANASFDDKKKYSEWIFMSTTARFNYGFKRQ